MTSIFDIAGVVPTQQQAERMTEPQPLNMPAYTPHGSVTLPNTMAATARKAFDETRQQNAIANEVQRRVAQAAQMKQAGLLHEAASQLERRMNQTGFSRLDTIGNFFNRQQANVLASGGVPVFVDGRYEGVIKDGRYSGNPYYDPVAVRQRNLFGEPEPQREVILPETDEVTGAKRCADGYIFDEQLGACRLAATLPNQPETLAYNFYQTPYEDEGLLGNYGANLIYG